MTTQEFIRILPFLIPIMLIDLGLKVYCITDLMKRKKVKFNNKWIWLAVILLINIIGSAIYLFFRGDDEYAGD